MHRWSVWVRGNSWSDAAEADGCYGKADAFTLKAHGTSATTATVMEGVRFPLAPDGELTVDGPRAS
ncbi:hypothetical protein [Streptomyces yunnanensis]|uniref:Uncharacterized protein n=1 Tax=Streptomyces yunnanensis TaxID=156453 RepID=A0A9X8N7F8_9ACTN|nr:hypothetical protein [Streptomyces yunnanensis]SHN22342.1 hypothetical protein SAMN05216268_12520 [Streptomyces yunnanensis]